MLRLNMIYWRDNEFWLGKFAEVPDVMAQGYSLEELEQNLKECYELMMLDDDPSEHFSKEVILEAW
jgi:predicted RNase H-like HicB family nuclease